MTSAINNGTIIPVSAEISGRAVTPVTSRSNAASKAPSELRVGLQNNYLKKLVLLIKLIDIKSWYQIHSQSVRLLQLRNQSQQSGDTATKFNKNKNNNLKIVCLTIYTQLTIKERMLGFSFR